MCTMVTTSGMHSLIAELSKTDQTRDLRNAHCNIEGKCALVHFSWRMVVRGCLGLTSFAQGAHWFSRIVA